MKQSKKPTKRRHSQHSRYLYQKFAWLYLHSGKARLSFAYLLLAAESKLRLEQKLIIFRNRTIAVYRHHLTVRTATALIILAVISVAAQLAYPKDRTLPFSRLEGAGLVGWKSESEMAAKLQGIDRQAITVQTVNSSIKTTPAEIGIELNESATFENLSQIPQSQKYIPFSILVSAVKPKSIERNIDQQKLDSFTSKIINEIHAEPRSADIKLQDSKLIVVPAKEGFRYHEANVKKQLIKLSLLDRKPLKLEAEVLLPYISTAMADDKAEFMQKRIDTPLTIWAADKNMTIDSVTLASWVDIVVKPEHQTISLSFNKDRVAETLKSFAGVLDVAAKPTVNTLLNGSLAGSVDGRIGRVLRFDELVNRVAESTDWSIKSVTAEIESILPKQTIVRSYSRDSQGIQSLLNQWVTDNGGYYSISMRTLNGNIAAEINSYQSIPSAGISRLYIAHLVYGRLNTNSLSADTPTSAGMNVANCLEQMMVHSQESCFYALGDIVGWDNNNSMLISQGFEGTGLGRGSGYTTASDTSEWLIKMYGSGIVSVPQTNALISMMSRHTSRSGIPAGSPGITVASSSSSYGGNYQDVGLVLHPRGAYVLSVLSSNKGRASSIAGLAAEINRVLSE